MGVYRHSQHSRKTDMANLIMTPFMGFDENFDYSLSSLSEEEDEMNCAEDLLRDEFHGQLSTYTAGLSNGLVVKAAGQQQRSGSKLRQKALRTRGGIDNNAAVNSVLCRKVVKRRCSPQDQTKPILYIFPSFDRSDALLFLPSTFASYINTANFNAMAKLFQTNFDKNCKFSTPFGPDSVASFLHFKQMLNEFHPDSIFCVHSTKVVENQIRSSVYAKFTSCKTIYDAVSKTVKNPLFMPFFGVQRSEHMRLAIEMSNCSEEEKNKMSIIVSSDADYVIYMHTECTYTFDDFTKKITRFDMTADFTSFEQVPSLA